MESKIVDSVSLDGSLQSGMSIWELFLAADPVVKAVMLLLILASIWCWAIIFDKISRLRKLRRKAQEFEDMFWSGGSLEDLYDRIGGTPADPMASVFAAAMREWRRSSARRLATKGDDIRASMRQRIEQVMSLTMGREMERLESNLSFLASVGSTAPFIGLFGTVWVIMNSFQSIAATKNTSLAVVAPGIAEALFATALGLIAAIPAVIAYNACASSVQRFAARLDHFADDFINLIARQSGPQSKG